MKDADNLMRPLAQLRESALQSPFALNNELRSLRPKPSTPTRNYSLPLKATPGEYSVTKLYVELIFLISSSANILIRIALDGKSPAFVLVHCF